VELGDFMPLMYKRDGRWKGVLLEDRDFSVKRYRVATNPIGQLFRGCPLFPLLPR
jgi:hypothetical protein